MLRATIVALLCLTGGCVVRGLDGGNNQGLGGNNNAPSADLGRVDGGPSNGDGGCTCSCGGDGGHVDLGRPDGGPIDLGDGGWHVDGGPVDGGPVDGGPHADAWYWDGLAVDAS